MVLSGLDSNKMALHHENSGSYLLDPALLVARLTQEIWKKMMQLNG